MSFIGRFNFFFLLLSSTMGALKKVKSMIKTKGTESSFICIVRASKVRRDDFCCDNKQYKQMFISYLDNRSTVCQQRCFPLASLRYTEAASVMSIADDMTEGRERASHRQLNTPAQKGRSSLTTPWLELGTSFHLITEGP